MTVTNAGKTSGKNYKLSTSKTISLISQDFGRLLDRMSLSFCSPYAVKHSNALQGARCSAAAFDPSWSRKALPVQVGGRRRQLESVRLECCDETEDHGNYSCSVHGSVDSLLLASAGSTFA